MVIYDDKTNLNVYQTMEYDKKKGWKEKAESGDYRG